jgi:hypothetical protein
MIESLDKDIEVDFIVRYYLINESIMQGFESDRRIF